MRPFRVVIIANLAFALGLSCGYVWWQADADRLRRELDGARAQAAATRGWTVKGIVRAVLESDGMVVITHEPLTGLMGSMTMAFRVKERALLRGLESGDRIDFAVVPEGKELVVTSLRKTP